MQKGQKGSFHDHAGQICDAVVTRVRGGNQVDINIRTGHPDGHDKQMVPVGAGREHFWPHGYDEPDAPPPTALARLVPRYVPVWHLAWTLPLAAGVSLLTDLVMHWLGGR